MASTCATMCGSSSVESRLTAATFLLIVAPAAIASYFATPTYEARAKLVMSGRPRARQHARFFVRAPNPELFQTQVQITTAARSPPA